MCIFGILSLGRRFSLRPIRARHSSTEDLFAPGRVTLASVSLSSLPPVSSPLLIVPPLSVHESLQQLHVDLREYR